MRLGDGLCVEKGPFNAIEPAIFLILKESCPLKRGALDFHTHSQRAGLQIFTSL
jgi:hypothetical protein